MNYFELNKAIAETLGLEFKCLHNVVMTKQGRNIDSAYIETDYCNNWNDLMPLVVEYRISLELYNLGRCGTYRLDCYGERIDDCMTTENPQRALAECLLKVLENKNG